MLYDKINNRIANAQSFTDDDGVVYIDVDPYGASMNGIIQIKAVTKNNPQYCVINDLVGLKVKCIKSLHKSTYNKNIFSKNKTYEIIEVFKTTNGTNMVVVKSPIVLGNGGIDFCLDDNNTYYTFNKHFKFI